MEDICTFAKRMTFRFLNIFHNRRITKASKYFQNYTLIWYLLKFYINYINLLSKWKWQNHGIMEVARKKGSLEVIWSSLPTQSRDNLGLVLRTSCEQLLNWILDTCKDKNLTAALDSLPQCLTILTVKLFPNI